MPHATGHWCFQDHKPPRFLQDSGQKKRRQGPRNRDTHDGSKFWLFFRLSHWKPFRPRIFNLECFGQLGNMILVRFITGIKSNVQCMHMYLYGYLLSTMWLSYSTFTYAFKNQVQITASNHVISWLSQILPPAIQKMNFTICSWHSNFNINLAA